MEDDELAIGGSADAEEAGLSADEKRRVADLGRAIWLASERLEQEGAPARSPEEQKEAWKRVRPRYVRIARQALRRLSARGYTLEKRPQ